MRRNYVLLVVILLVAATAVYAQYAAVAKSGLSVSVRANRSRYEVGEPVDMSLLLINSSGGNLNYQFANTPIYDCWVTSTDGKEVWRYSNGKSFTGRQTLSIEAGASKTYTVTWNQTDNQGKAAQPGWYEVFARFSGEMGIDPVRTRVRIGGGAAPTQLIIQVPVSSSSVNLPGDLGKTASVAGVLRQGPQGLYLDVKDFQVKR
jgi:hypothetical protein